MIDFTKCRRKAPCFNNGDIKAIIILLKVI